MNSSASKIYSTGSPVSYGISGTSIPSSITTNLGTFNTTATTISNRDWTVLDYNSFAKLVCMCLTEAEISDMLKTLSERIKTEYEDAEYKEKLFESVLRDILMTRHFSEDFLLKSIEYVEFPIRIYAIMHPEINTGEYSRLAFLFNVKK